MIIKFKPIGIADDARVEITLAILEDHMMDMAAGDALEAALVAMTGAKPPKGLSARSRYLNAFSLHFAARWTN